MEPFIGQIMLFGGLFTPRGWATCDGQLLSTDTYSALFSILGTTYGGNGRTDFRLPDLRGRTPIHQGQGPGLRYRRLGEQGGAETHQLSVAEMPVHSHPAMCYSGIGTVQAPTNAIPADEGHDNFKLFAPEGSADKLMGGATAAGGIAAHNNMQPFLAIQYCIALEGVFPPRR